MTEIAVIVWRLGRAGLQPCRLLQARRIGPLGPEAMFPQGLKPPKISHFPWRGFSPALPGTPQYDAEFRQRVLVREAVGRTVFVAEILVRRRVVGKTLLPCIPFQIRFGLKGNICNQGCGSTAMAGFDITIARVSAAHAIEEVTRMEGSAVRALHFLGLDHGVPAIPPPIVHRPVKRR